MSLWRYKRAIGKAVAGELSAEQEQSLRNHLRICQPCQSHYNVLSALLAVSAPAKSVKRERSRLLQLLGDAPIKQARTARRWLWSLPILATTAALLLWVRAMPTSVDDAPVWRGGDQVETETWPLSLLIYGLRKGGPSIDANPEVLGELPYSQGVSINKNTLVQFGYKGLQKQTFVYVQGEQASKRVTLFPRRAQDNGALAPTMVAKAVGSSLDLGAVFGVGRVQLSVLFSPTQLSATQIQEAFAATVPPKQFRVFKESLTLNP